MWENAKIKWPGKTRRRFGGGTIAIAFQDDWRSLTASGKTVGETGTITARKIKS